MTARLVDGRRTPVGLKKRCLTTMHLYRTAAPMVIEDVDADATAAIDRAVDRAARAVGRTVARANTR